MTIEELMAQQEKDQFSRFVSKDCRETTVDPLMLDERNSDCGYNYDQYHGWHRDDV